MGAYLTRQWTLAMQIFDRTSALRTEMRGLLRLYIGPVSVG
jgi:hypothetical protein